MCFSDLTPHSMMAKATDNMGINPELFAAIASDNDRVRSSVDYKVPYVAITGFGGLPISDIFKQMAEFYCG